MVEFIIIWCGIGLAGILLGFIYYDGLGKEGRNGLVIMGLLGGPIFSLWLIQSIYEEKKQYARYEAQSKEKEIKAKQKKEKALEELPILLQRVQKNLILIKADNSKLSKKFFDDTRKILGYCSILNKNELTKIDILKDILIFARLNVLQFYEANNIKNAERLSKKINTILRKIK